MPIINRDLGKAAQRNTIEFTSSVVVATGATIPVCAVPYPCSLDLGQMTVSGVSGSPVGQLWINRFIVGAGITTFAVSSSFALSAYSTSGMLSITSGISLPQIGSTLTTLYANDVLLFALGGTTSAVTSLVGGVVLRPIQDEVHFFGIL